MYRPRGSSDLSVKEIKIPLVEDCFWRCQAFAAQVIANTSKALQKTGGQEASSGRAGIRPTRANRKQVLRHGPRRNLVDCALNRWTDSKIKIKMGQERLP